MNGQARGQANGQGKGQVEGGGESMDGSRGWLMGK